MKRMRNRRGLLPYIAGAAVCLALGGCGEEAAAPNESGTEIGVVVKTFQNERIYETLTLPGNVEAIEDTTLSAEVAGQLASLAVTEGQTVKVGDMIAEIDPATAEAMLNQAVKQVASAEKTKEAAEAGLTVAEAGVDEAQANRDRAVQRLASIKKLSESGNATRDELDEASTLATIAEAQVRKAKASVKASKANIASAEAAIAVAEANQELAQINRKKHTIKSPVAGTVDDLPVDPKEFVRVGTPLCRIVRTDKLKVIVNTPERDVQFVEAMQRRYETADPNAEQGYIRDDQPLVRFKMLASGLQQYGKIEWIARVADPMTRTYETRILIDNKTGRIRPGMIATVQIVRRVNHQAICVPLDALATRGGRSVIYLYKPDKDDPDVGTAVEETAKFGLMDSSRVEILKLEPRVQIIGLKPGVRVIVNWDIELSAGDRVRVKKWLDGPAATRTAEGQG